MYFSQRQAFFNHAVFYINAGYFKILRLIITVDDGYCTGGFDKNKILGAFCH
jgi:hypothetical protein